MDGGDQKNEGISAGVGGEQAKERDAARDAGERKAKRGDRGGKSGTHTRRKGGTEIRLINTWSVTRWCRAHTSK